MFAFVGVPFASVQLRLKQMLVDSASDVDVGQWHATDVSGLTGLVSRELLNVSIELTLPREVTTWQIQVEPNLPWAEDHFWERVGRQPLNPGKEYKNWPWADGYFDEFFQKEGKFSHSYMERFWPKWAERPAYALTHRGIRFDYGDLDDVVTQLVKHPLTRQAYLPVFFPEDTGAVHGERVPCTLGYHFIIRNNRLHCTYYIRSCDFVRYFADDVYLAGRLAQWVWFQVYKLSGVAIDIGKLLVHITSLHAFQGDMDKMKRELELGT